MIGAGSGTNSSSPAAAPRSTRSRKSERAGRGRDAHIPRRRHHAPHAAAYPCGRLIETARRERCRSRRCRDLRRGRPRLPQKAAPTAVAVVIRAARGRPSGNPPNGNPAGRNGSDRRFGQASPPPTSPRDAATLHSMALYGVAGDVRALHGVSRSLERSWHRMLQPEPRAAYMGCIPTDQSAPSTCATKAVVGSLGAGLSHRCAWGTAAFAAAFARRGARHARTCPQRHPRSRRGG
jgi:hypothetical protein